MRCEIDGQTRNVPDFLIVGTGKAGTSSLQSYLQQHPQVVVPQIKESLFFHIVSNPNKTQMKILTQACTNWEDYLKYFDDAQEGMFCGEACPSYMLFYEHTIANIKTYHPRWEELKIVIMLREPMSKVISQYFDTRNRLGDYIPTLRAETLEQTIRKEPERLADPNVLCDLYLMESTSYVKQIKAFREAFTNVRIFLFDDLRDHPEQFYADFTDFLGIQDIPPSAKKKNVGKRNEVPKGVLGRTVDAVQQMGIVQPLLGAIPESIKSAIKSQVYKREDVPEKTRALLKEKFRPEIKELETLIDRDLSAWGY